MKLNMMKFSNSNRTEFEKWLASSYVHDSVITEYLYETKQKALQVTLINTYFHTRMTFRFENVKALSVINKNELGNSEVVIAGVLEKDYSFFEEKLDTTKPSKDEEYLYFVFQMLSMDEVHILFESVTLNVSDNDDAIDEILDMLDWNNPSEIQEKGRELACKVGVIEPFIQPVTPKHGKNVWENCAKIVSLQSDDVLLIHLTQLFEWLQDMNWPGADIIYQRLLSVSMNYIDVPFKVSFEKACRSKDIVWKDVLVRFWNEYQFKL